MSKKFRNCGYWLRNHRTEMNMSISGLLPYQLETIFWEHLELSYSRPYSWSNSTTYWRREVSCPTFTGNASAVISGLMTLCFRVDTRDELLGCNNASAEDATDTRTLLGCPWKMITCIMWITRSGRFGWRYRRTVDHEVTKQGTSLRDHWRLG